MVSDQGRQFTSGVWSELASLLGFAHSTTTAYHPQSNGMVERLHRTLKERLMARACATGASSWMDHLPFVLLGLRTSVREDSNCAPADLLYGCHLRLPGDLVCPAPPVPAASDFAKHLQSCLKSSSPMPAAHHGNHPSHVLPALAQVSHVLLRVDAVRRPLTPPYEGPFPVIRRGTKTFVISRRGKETVVSVDRLKPAFLWDPAASASPAPSSAAPGSPRLDAPPADIPAVVAPAAPVNLEPTVFTSSGRASRPPQRYTPC